MEIRYASRTRVQKTKGEFGAGYDSSTAYVKPQDKPHEEKGESKADSQMQRFGEIMGLKNEAPEVRKAIISAAFLGFSPLLLGAPKLIIKKRKEDLGLD
jgi:hypothetical protein